VGLNNFSWTLTMTRRRITRVLLSIVYVLVQRLFGLIALRRRGETGVRPW